MEPRSGSLSSRAANKEHSPHMKMSHLTPSGSSQLWAGFSYAAFEEEKCVLHNSVMVQLHRGCVQHRLARALLSAEKMPQGSEKSTRAAPTQAGMTRDPDEAA